MTRIRVRQASPADARAIAGVGVRSWREGFRGLVPEEIDPERAWTPYGMAERLETEEERSTTTLVAEDGAQVVGFLIHGPTRDSGAPSRTGEIWVLYVDPDHWRRGVGRDLVATAIAELTAAGFETATVWTLGESARNVAFYEALGFRRDGATQRREAFGRTLEVRLSRPLA